MGSLIQFNNDTGKELLSRKAVTAFLVFLFFAFLLTNPGHSQEKGIEPEGSHDHGSEASLYPEGHGLKLSEISSESLLFNIPYQSTQNESIFNADRTGLILLSMAAEKRGLHLGLDFRNELEWQRLNLLAGYYLRQISRDWNMSQKRLKEFYDHNLERYITPEAVRIRHILVHESTIAYTVLLRLMSGEPFGSLAEDYSKDLSTALDDGDLGWFWKGQLPKYMEEKVFQLEPECFTGPLESSYGFHIIQCIEKRPALQLTYPEVSDEVYEDLIEYYVEEEIRSLESIFVLPGSVDK